MILCVGEILADLIGVKDNGLVTYKCYAGGAPFNVACGLNKLGIESAFVGAVGEDSIGRFLIETAKSLTNDLSFIPVIKDVNTTLAFVELNNGERSFDFYRKNTADKLLTFDMIPMHLLHNASIVHVGSLMLSNSLGQKLFEDITRYCLDNKKLLSFDVNLRQEIINKNPSIVKNAIKKADILKLSIDELSFATGIEDLNTALNSLDNPIVFVTMGKEGSVCKTNNMVVKIDSITVDAIDTTGAGDAFFASVLSSLHTTGIKNLDKISIENILKYANCYGAFTTTKMGAIDAMPTKTSFNQLMERYYKD